MNQLNLEDFKVKIGEKWWKYLLPFFESEAAYNIYQTLKQDAKTDGVTPASKDTWRFLSEIDPENVKIVIFGLDSYPGRYNKNLLHATGILFDCSNSPDGKLQPSLIELWNGLSAEFEQELPKEADLTFLLQQGVLLANRGITCKLFKSGSHLDLWTPFWEIFFQEYVNKRPDVPIIFLGNDAKKLKKFVAFNKTFELQHPSFNARNGTLWETKGVFKRCNRLLAGLNGVDSIIQWNYDLWKQGIKSMHSPTLDEINEVIDTLPF